MDILLNNTNPFMNNMMGMNGMNGMNGMMYGGNFIDKLFTHLIEQGWQGLTLMTIINFYLYLSLERIKDLFKYINDKLAEKCKEYMESYGNKLTENIKLYLYNIVIFLWNRIKMVRLDLIIFYFKKKEIALIKTKINERRLATNAG